MSADARLKDAKVWDLPTRIFHWLLVASVAAGWLIGDNMSFATVQWHFYLGYATGGLLIFRLVWGIVGPRPVRLGALAPRPGEVMAYLKHMFERRPSGVAGHNPLGALSALALLTALSVQVASGLFAETDELFSEGPLSHLLSNAGVRYATWIHGVSSDVVLALVALHVGAILFYLIWKRENLNTPMITGWKKVRRG